MDVDLAAQLNSPESALDALLRIGERDLGDFFTFRFGRTTRLVQGLSGLRVSAEAWLGPRLFERFGVDVVTGAVITGTPQVGGPLVPIDIPGLVRSPYLLYPVVDTVADKVAGIVERHGGKPSTRFRDLVDLVLIAKTQRLDARALATAIESEERRRGYPWPDSLIVPEIDAWKAGYARVAAAIPHVQERSLHEAVEVASALVDPILQGRVAAMESRDTVVGIRSR